MSDLASIRHTVDHLFRHEAGKMTAVLTRLLGLEQLETAQDIVQDTLLQAMTTWSFSSIPDNPGAWLYRVAKNKALDHLRREKRYREIIPQYDYLIKSEYALKQTINNFFLENEIPDSQLRMMFACCHPCIPMDSQIALTLKALCGLSVGEISKAYLATEETITKRIFRAKEKIRLEKIDLEVPLFNELPKRVDAVLKCLYLLFNEGYNSSQPDHLIREDLCSEALRLCYLLSEHSLTRCSRVDALLALMCFQSSRLNARLDDKGNIILLKYQDRSRWNHDLIKKGYHYIDRAAMDPVIGSYHLEAGIASLHAAAPSFEQTDWRSIYDLYEILYKIEPGPFVALNKAIASAYAISKDRALEELKQIKGLGNYHLYFASTGEILFDQGKKAEARQYFEKAASLTSSQTEKQLLHDKAGLC